MVKIGVDSKDGKSSKMERIDALGRYIMQEPNIYVVYILYVWKYKNFGKNPSIKASIKYISISKIGCPVKREN